MSAYEKNRSQIPLTDLTRHAGQWVAFSLDGTRILASAPNIGELEDRLGSLGVDLGQVAFERIEFEDSQLGGAELL